MLRVSIVDIQDGLHELTLTPEPAELDLDPELFRDLRVGLRLDRQRDRIFVMLDVEGRATLECDRTLQLFEQEVEGHHEVLFVPPDETEAAGDDLDEVRPWLPEEQEIDLTVPAGYAAAGVAAATHRTGRRGAGPADALRRQRRRDRPALGGAAQTERIHRYRRRRCGRRPLAPGSR